MPSTSYDTRFFVEHYYSNEPRTVGSTRREVSRQRDKAISSVVIHEVYRFTLQKEGREVAKLRVELLARDFKIVPVDKGIAVASAELRQKYAIPMADSIVAATSVALKAVCVTDDPHLQKVREIKTRWI